MKETKDRRLDMPSTMWSFTPNNGHDESCASNVGCNCELFPVEITQTLTETMVDGGHYFQASASALGLSVTELGRHQVRTIGFALMKLGRDLAASTRNRGNT